MITRNIDELAETIATTLLTPHLGQECHRMQLMYRKDAGTEVNMGGRCKQNMVDTIKRILENTKVKTSKTN